MLNELFVKRFRKQKKREKKMFKAKKDGDEKIFQNVKMFTDDLSEQFEEVNSYFVDSSGFGVKGEPALTADEFLEKVKAGRFYAITDIGQFQVNIGEYVKIERE